MNNDPLIKGGCGRTDKDTLKESNASLFILFAALALTQITIALVIISKLFN